MHWENHSNKFLWIKILKLISIISLYTFEKCLLYFLEINSKKKLISCIKIQNIRINLLHILYYIFYKFDQNPAFNWIKIISIFENIEIVKFFFKELYYK